MINTLLKYIAPHHCCGCDEIGTLLCPNCKYDIISEPFEMCVACGSMLVANGKICASCKVPYSRAWCAGGRQGSLEALVDVYKFDNAKAGYKPLAALLDDTLPELPGDIVVVPIPTIPTHIRQRGYDHMRLVAKEFARQRDYRLDTCLKRTTSTMQRGSGRSQRIKQAKQAFECTAPLDSNTIYLLLDDVVTTGSTLKYAAKTLCDAGAGTVWVAAISRQALD